MASNMDTRPCVTGAWGFQYTKYHEAETGVWIELLQSSFSSIDLVKTDKALKPDVFKISILFR